MKRFFGKEHSSFHIKKFLLLVLLPSAAKAQNILELSATEQKLTALLAILAFVLFIILVLYRRQRKLTKLLLQESRTDYLTNVSNRRHFFELLNKYVSLAKRHNQSLSLLAIDIDYFKKINDTYGHSTGDRVLQKVAEALGKIARSEDCVGRTGGEEFAILLPMTSKEGSVIFAERARKQVEALDLPLVGKGMNVTISIGISTFSTDFTPVLFYQSADDALYQAKDSGRNCVIHSS